jgi:hypothetical protein
MASYRRGFAVQFAVHFCQWLVIAGLVAVVVFIFEKLIF